MLTLFLVSFQQKKKTTSKKDAWVTLIPRWAGCDTHYSLVQAEVTGRSLKLGPMDQRKGVHLALPWNRVVLCVSTVVGLTLVPIPLYTNKQNGWCPFGAPLKQPPKDFLPPGPNTTRVPTTTLPPPKSGRRAMAWNPPKDSTNANKIWVRSTKQRRVPQVSLQNSPRCSMPSDTR